MSFVLSKVRVTVTWQFLALITFMLSLQKPNVLFAVLFSLCHEIGHLICLVLVGNKPKSVSFELTGINICRNESVAVSLKNEMLVSFGGPLVNLIFFAVFSIAYSQTKTENYFNIASVNLILGVFNLLPIKSLDGGKILYYFISNVFSFKTAKIILNFTSVIFILLILIYGIYTLYVTEYNFTILIISIMLTLSMFSKEEC